jgi:hypothetical protein
MLVMVRRVGKLIVYDVLFLAWILVRCSLFKILSKFHLTCVSDV